MAAPHLFKTIFQARYAPKLRFFELLLPAAQRFPEYPHWRTNQVDITLRDLEKRCSLSLQSKFFAYEQDSSDADLARGNISKAIEVLPSALEIESFSRLGLRCRYLCAVELDFPSLVTVLSVKLLAQDEHLREILPERTEDMLYRIDAAQQEHRYHITVAPVRRAEIPRALSFNEEQHVAPETAVGELAAIRAAYPEVAIFFDIDLYREGQMVIEEGGKFLQTGEKVIEKLVTDLRNYLLAVDVGG